MVIFNNDFILNNTDYAYTAENNDISFESSESDSSINEDFATSGKRYLRKFKNLQVKFQCRKCPRRFYISVSNQASRIMDLTLIICKAV